MAESSRIASRSTKREKDAVPSQAAMSLVSELSPVPSVGNGIGDDSWLASVSSEKASAIGVVGLGINRAMVTASSGRWLMLNVIVSPTEAIPGAES